MRHFFILVLLICSSGFLRAQTYVGTDFRFAFLANIEPPFNGLPNFDISIEAYEAATVTVEYGLPSDPFYLTQSITLTAGENGVVSFDQINLEQQNTNVVESRSFHVTSTGEIRLYGFHNRVYFSEATPVLPTDQLTNDYMVLTHPDPDGVAPSLFSVLATEDDTEVEIITTADSPGITAGLPFNINLDAGEVITIASTEDLTGSTITSDPDKPIAVFAGNRQAEINASCGADSHLYEQLHPTDYWGSIHPVYPVVGNGGDLVKILAKEDGTEIYEDCELIATIDRGETYEAIYTDPLIIRSSSPVLIGMITRGLDCSNYNTGDPNLRFLYPLNRGNTGIKLANNTGFQMPQAGVLQFYFLHVVMPTDQTDQITINGNSVAAPGWTPFNSLPSFSHLAYVVTDISEMDMVVESTVPFWSEYVALSFADAMSMSLGTTTTMELPDTEVDEVSLGPDQTICEGQTIILDPDLGVEGVWQDGSEQLTYEVTEPGTYSVTIQSTCETVTDEVIITLADELELGLPETYVLCAGSEVEIGVSDDPSIDYEWGNGATASEITVTQEGEYTLSGSIDGFCPTSETTTVTAVDPPELNVDGPAEICEGAEATLEANGDPGTYLWNDGSENSTLLIDAAGTYTVSLTDADGCVTTESITVTNLSGPDLTIEGPENICAEEVQTLIATGDEGDFVWEDGTVGNQLSISAPGRYAVTLTNDDGCSSERSILVPLLSLPIIRADDVEICASQTAILSASSPNATVTWAGTESSESISVEEGGTYQVIAENRCGMNIRDVIVTEIDCECYAYVPNAFSPNGDGLNDLFAPHISCEPSVYSLQIFNRWGELVFESENRAEKWNGGSGQDYYSEPGAYIYLIEYDNPLFPLEEKVTLRGTVMLLR